MQSNACRVNGVGLVALLSWFASKPLPAMDGPNQRWSVDSVSDALTDGRRFRILAVVDDSNRETLVLVADTSLFGALGDARETLEELQVDDNWRRPHSALGNLTPMEFLHRKVMDKMAA